MISAGAHPQGAHPPERPRAGWQRQGDARTTGSTSPSAVLQRDGVAPVTVLDLSERLRVSRSSFYWYFRDRADFSMSS